MILGSYCDHLALMLHCKILFVSCMQKKTWPQRPPLHRILNKGLCFFYIVVILTPLFASHSPLLLFPFVLLDAVEQTAGDEGHGHEEDYGRAYNGCQHGHTETIVLIGSQSWSVREKKTIDWFIIHISIITPFITLQNLCLTIPNQTSVSNITLPELWLW